MIISLHQITIIIRITPLYSHDLYIYKEKFIIKQFRMYVKIVNMDAVNIMILIV